MPACSASRSGRAAPPEGVPVFADLGATAPASEMGFAAGRLVADLDAFRAVAFADGRCPLTWRQGLKHDAASVMELIRDGGCGAAPQQAAARWSTSSRIPSIPCSRGPTWPRPRSERPRRFGDRDPAADRPRDGADSSTRRPRLWRYLHAHAADFRTRKSSIYRGQPPFAMFGIGPYSFAPHKVAISGLHKAPSSTPSGRSRVGP